MSLTNLPPLKKIQEDTVSDTSSDSLSSHSQSEQEEVETKLPKLKFDAKKFASQARMSRNFADELLSLGSLIQKSKTRDTLQSYSKTPTIQSAKKLNRQAQSEHDLRYLTQCTVKKQFGISSVYTSLEPTPRASQQQQKSPQQELKKPRAQSNTLNL